MSSIWRIRAYLAWDYPKFKVPLVWRDIEIRDDQTLTMLHVAIQYAFQWYNDHAYAFYLNQDTPSERVYAHPDFLEVFKTAKNPSPNWTSDRVTLRELGLSGGSKIVYEYDFGDGIYVDLEVLTTARTLKKTGKYPRVIAVHSYSPEQYSYSRDGYSRKVVGELERNSPKIIRIKTQLKELKILKRYCDRWAQGFESGAVVTRGSIETWEKEQIE